MNGSEIINTLSKGIDMLSKKLGVAASKIYPILLKQAYVDMYIKIFIVVVSIVTFTVTIVLAKKYLKSLKTEGGWFYKNWNDTGILSSSCGMTTIFVGIGLILMGLSSICFMVSNIIDIIQIAINPQYYIFTQYIQPLIK